MTGHPDADVLAEFREGLLGRRRSARIGAHLARCSRCASLDRGLAEVTALLASAPVPRIPDELASQLDGVLAAESAARARAGTPAAADRSTGAAREAGRPRPAARSGRSPRPWRATALRAASVTAALLVIAGGGYGVSRLVQGGGSGATSSAASAPRHPAPGAAAPAAGTGQPGNPGPRSQVEQPTAGAPVIRSGTDYLPGRLPAQVKALLARYPASFAGRLPVSASESAATLQGCVKLITGGARPRLVDVARYQGRQATVIVRAAAGGRPGQIWVVGPGCSATSRDLITHARLTGTG